MNKLVVVWGGALAVAIGVMHTGFTASPSSHGAIIDVSTVAQLQSAVANLTSGTTIRIAPGRYALTQELWVRNGVTNVALVGATGDRDDVVIVGTGMNTPGVNIALKISNAQDVRIADLSIGEAYWHPIQLQGEAGADRIHVSNVRLFDAGQQFLKSTVDSQAPNGVDEVIVEYSLVEYTVIGPAHGYTEGIDVHHGANWVIRHNVFRNIHVPATAPDKYRPAVLMWSGSRDTIVHSNTFINCERAIIFGLGPKPPFPYSHSGGLIYNNVIYRDQPVNADAGISIWDSPGTRVYHNTVIQNGTYPNAIEYRFASTTNVEIINNLTDGAIARRDDAQAVVSNNFTAATHAMFVNAPLADLHLMATATAALDKGMAIPAVTTDWDGEPRPAGAAPDLGADERHVMTNLPPLASFTASPESGPVPLTVVFDGRTSVDPEGGPLTMTWAFGDGQTASGATATHTYLQAGTFVAILTARDAQGLTATATTTIVVGAAPPIGAPGNLQAVASNGSVQLTWVDRSTAETDVVIERAGSKRDTFVEIARVGANVTSFTDNSLSRGWYRYRVRACSAVTGQCSPYSNIVEVRVH
jgi:PKD repeat protein